MFQRIMTEKPDVMSKITPVYGDISLANFGLNQKHLRKVVDETQIFFHLAASLKMTAPLKTNVKLNVVGTKNALELAKQMKNLVQMLHLSTAFCNIEPEIVYEKVYEFKHDPIDLMRLIEWMDDKAMLAIEKELMGDHPNSYTYTKRLAEILVEREFENLPVAIVRPSVVFPSLEEPVSGWVDNLNGICGVTLAGGKGVLQSFFSDPKSHVDSIPVDLCINAMLMIVKVLSTEAKHETLPVFHLTLPSQFKVKFYWLFNKLIEFRFKYPFTMSLWLRFIKIK